MLRFAWARALLALQGAGAIRPVTTAALLLCSNCAEVQAGNRWPRSPRGYGHSGASARRRVSDQPNVTGPREGSLRPANCTRALGRAER
jgi:hypothetical protein